jgi:DNA-binding NtrC family response regulator
MNANAEERASILVVDDQKNWRDVLRLTLQKEYSVTAVENLDGARQVLFQPGRPFHAAVIDIRLDDADRSNQDGLHLAHEIHSRLDGLTSIVLITAYPSVYTIDRGMRELAALRYVEKYPQKGGRFDLKSFLQAVSEAVEQAAKLRNELDAQAALLVEDEDGWRNLLREIVRREGLTVDVAASSEEAKLRAEETDYSLFVVDLKLGAGRPEEGIRLIDSLKHIRPRARFIVVTGYGTIDLARSALSEENRSRMEGFFDKYPFNRDRFLDAVRHVLLVRGQERLAGC